MSADRQSARLQCRKRPVGIVGDDLACRPCRRQSAPRMALRHRPRSRAIRKPHLEARALVAVAGRARQRDDGVKGILFPGRSPLSAALASMMHSENGPARRALRQASRIEPVQTSPPRFPKPRAIVDRLSTMMRSASAIVANHRTVALQCRRDQASRPAENQPPPDGSFRPGASIIEAATTSCSALAASPLAFRRRCREPGAARRSPAKEVAAARDGVRDAQAQSRSSRLRVARRSSPGPFPAARARASKSAAEIRCSAVLRRLAL